MKPTTIRLSLDTIQRIEKLVGNRRLAVFIREAVENELKRRENPEPPKA
jgi:predicted DNA-binding protein